MPDHTQNDILGNNLDRLGNIHLSPCNIAFCAPGLSAEQLVELVVRHPETVKIAEVIQVQPERSVIPQVDQVIPDNLFVRWFTIGRQAHELVFSRIDPESREVGERRIEESQGMRKTQLADQLYPVVFAVGYAAGSPFANAIQRDNCGSFERRREERAGGVGLMMFRKEHLAGQFYAALYERFLDLHGDPELLSHP